MNQNQVGLRGLDQFVNQNVRIYLNESTIADKIEGSLLSVDQMGLTLAETTTRSTYPQGVYFYPWSAIRTVHLTENVKAFRNVA